MTKQEADALLVLAPGVFIRAGVRCPHCRSLMHPQHQWRVEGEVIDWVHECEGCGTVLDTNLRVIWSLDCFRPGAKRRKYLSKHRSALSF